jgi:broad specificity phosphatase PhoE
MPANTGPYRAVAASRTSPTVAPGSVSSLVPAASRADANKRILAMKITVPARSGDERPPRDRHPRQCQIASVRSPVIMLNVLIARHGQSEWNALGRWQGQADSPLTELGRAQAAGAATQMGAFDAIIASDLDRALSTAAIIAEGIGVGPVLVDPGFRERHAGEYQGLTREEINERYPGELNAGIWPPGWEHDDDVHDRVTEALGRVAEQVVTGEVLVVSHGGVIYSLERRLGAHHVSIDNLGARWFHNDGESWRLGERVQLSLDATATENQDIL